MTKYAKCVVLGALALALSACHSSGKRNQASEKDCDYIPSRGLVHDKMSDGLRRYLKTCLEEWMHGGLPGDEQLWHVDVKERECLE